MASKQEIINRAVALISSYPASPVSRAGVPGLTTSAEVFYDTFVETQMESFFFGFGLNRFTLQNPILETEGYITFVLPENVGAIFAVAPLSEFPEIEFLVGKSFTRNLGRYPAQKLSGNRLRILHPEAYSEDLVLGYVGLDPSPDDMTVNFRAAIQYFIASQLALKNIQQKDVFRMLEVKARMYMARAKKFSIDNKNFFEFLNPGLAKAAQYTSVSGRTIEPSLFLKGD